MVISTDIFAVLLRYFSSSIGNLIIRTVYFKTGYNVVPKFTSPRHFMYAQLARAVSKCQMLVNVASA